MMKRHLSLVLVEYPPDILKEMIYRGSRIQSIQNLRFFEGMLEITFFDGTIKVFNRKETTEILDNSNDYVKDLLELDDLLSP